MKNSFLEKYKKIITESENWNYFGKKSELLCSDGRFVICDASPELVRFYNGLENLFARSEDLYKLAMDAEQNVYKNPKKFKEAFKKLEDATALKEKYDFPLRYGWFSEEKIRIPAENGVWYNTFPNYGIEFFLCWGPYSEKDTYSKTNEAFFAIDCSFFLKFKSGGEKWFNFLVTVDPKAGKMTTPKGNGFGLGNRNLLEKLQKDEATQEFLSNLFIDIWTQDINTETNMKMTANEIKDFKYERIYSKKDGILDAPEAERF